MALIPLKMKAPRDQNKKITFNWGALDLEMWRGPDGDFPTEVTLYMTPDFDGKVLAAIDSFPSYYLVLPDDIHHRILSAWELETPAHESFKEMTGEDLGMRLHYIDGNYVDKVLNLCMKADVGKVIQ